MDEAYGDESYDAGKTSYAVAAVLGSEREWEAVQIDWLKVTKGIPFHATDCDSDRGDYKPFSHEENKATYRAVCRVVRDSNLVAYAAAFDLNAFVRVFPETVKTSVHFYCVFRVLKEIAEWTRLSLSQEQVKVTFDQNENTDHSVSMVYDQMRRSKNWSAASFLACDEISFANWRKNPRLQIADLIAHEAMKHMVNVAAGSPRPTRGSLRILDNAKRVFMDMLQQGFFEGWKNSISGREPKFFALYEKWLATEGLTVDNMTNRLMFNAWVDSVGQDF